MNPFQIGVVTIGGAAVLLSTLLAGTLPPSVRTLLIDNSLGSGDVFLGKATMNIVTLVGVVLIIPSGQARSIGGFKNADDINWQAYSLHGSSAGDLVNVTGQTVS